eukprot:gene15297-biopygen9232
MVCVDWTKHIQDTTLDLGTCPRGVEELLRLLRGRERVLRPREHEERHLRGGRGRRVGVPRVEERAHRTTPRNT